MPSVPPEPSPPAEPGRQGRPPHAARGRLARGSSAPASGEETSTLAALGPVRVEQILSGRLAGPADYVQDHDEWVVLLDGAAVLDVDGQRCELEPGDWVLLPSGVPHTLVSTRPGSSWLAVHMGGTSDTGAGA